MQDVLICFEFWKKCNMFGIVACEYAGTRQSERANGTDTTLKTNKPTKKEMKRVLFLATSTELKEGGLWAEPGSGLKTEVELGSHSHSWTDCLAADTCFSKHSLHSCRKSKLLHTGGLPTSLTLIVLAVTGGPFVSSVSEGRSVGTNYS